MKATKKRKKPLLTKKQKAISNLAKQAFENKKTYREVSIELTEKQISEFAKKQNKYEIEKKLKSIRIFEIEPALRNILMESYSLFGGAEYTDNYYLSFPYMQFYSVNSPYDTATYISCTNKPIKKNSIVYHVPLPNAGCDRILEPICFGQKIKKEKEKEAENIIYNYFNRVFNNSHHDWIDFPKEIKNFKNWQKNSILNPNYGTKIKWKNGIAIEELLFKITQSIIEVF